MKIIMYILRNNVSHTCTCLNYLYFIIIGRHRFVFYARKDFDASQVPPEWLVRV